MKHTRAKHKGPPQRHSRNAGVWCQQWLSPKGGNNQPVGKRRRPWRMLQRQLIANARAYGYINGIRIRGKGKKDDQ